jgi:inner membrane protein
LDTLTHALSGALLARLIAVRLQTSAVSGALAGAGAPGRCSAPWDGQPAAPRLWQFVVVGAVAGAFPDVDVVAQLFGDLAYLRHHRGITHSVLMLPLWALLVAWLMSRCFAGTRRQPGAWKSLYVIAAAGIGIHIAGDWITQFGTMLLEPFSDRRFGLGAMFIIDLVLSGALLVGLLLAAIWPRRRWPAALGLMAAIAWVGVGWVGKHEAIGVGERYAAAQGIAAPQIVVMPRPASPFNWTVAVFDGRDYQLAHVNTRRSEPMVAGPEANFIRRFSAPYLPETLASWDRIPKLGDVNAPGWVADAFEHEDFRFFRWFAETPALIAADERRQADGSVERCAWFRDLRFEFPGREVGPFRYGLCLDGDTAQPYRLENGQREPV